jgi:hypothetical protein
VIDLVFDESFRSDLAVEFFGVLLSLAGLALLTWLGAHLAEHYQTRGKVKEFRFEHLRDATKKHGELIEAASDLWIEKGSLQLARGRITPDRGQISQAESSVRERDQRFSGLYREALDLAFVQGVLFTTATQKLWLEMLRLFERAQRSEDLEEIRSYLAQVSEKWAAFLKAAAEEIPLPYSWAEIEVPERADTDRQVSEIIDRIKQMNRREP